MARCRLPARIALALVIGAVVWALTGLPGGPAACLPDDCDCEAPGPGPIRQPANAWSSLALAAAGLFLSIASPGRSPGEPRGPQTRAEGASSSPRRRRGRRPHRASAAAGVRRRRASPGPSCPSPNPLPAGREAKPRQGNTPVAPTRQIAAGAVVAAGSGAFLYHAGLTAWTARLDGILVAVLIGTLAVHALARIAEGREPRGDRRGISWRRLAAWPLLVLGVAAWWLGQAGGPWCRPASPWQPHAAWHLLAAAALGLWLGPGRSGPQPPAPSSLRGERAAKA